MADINPQPNEYNQLSFVGGMSLQGDDTRLQANQYRIGFNLTNRFDQLDPIKQSLIDYRLPHDPNSIVQELVTFGNFIIAFIDGFAYYRYYTDFNWIPIPGFQMNRTAARFWTIQVPVATTNYYRLANTATTSTASAAGSGVQLAAIAGASQGNVPGLLVQDNINQPQFIFLDGNGNIQVRTTQSFQQWSITFTDATNVTVATDDNDNILDNREYVPIGSSMAWANGILAITAQDGNSMLRSVSGRPLDFIIAIANTLAINTQNQIISIQGVDTTILPFTMQAGGTVTDAGVYTAGGDAYATNYSVGVGGITCVRPISTGGWFIAASNANFAVTLNTTPNAPTIFGEYTFLRQFLFNATILDDRCIFDSIGDTRFIALDGLRSYNAVMQLQNEGRNSPFSMAIQQAFETPKLSIVQTAGQACGILFNNYELYAVNTIFGPAIAKFDTINNCWVGFDIVQVTPGANIKMLAKIELGNVLRLYAIDTTNNLYTLYIGPENATASFRTASVCSNMLYANQDIKMNRPKSEVQLKTMRLILNNVEEDYSISFTPYVNNRLTKMGTSIQNHKFEAAIKQSTDATDLPDVNTQLNNLLFSTPDCAQGWKTFGIISWAHGSITQFSMELSDLTPMQSLRTQNL